MKDDFAKYLTRFFTSYLSGERGLSHNTIRAYGNTFLSFIDFMEKTRCIKGRQDIAGTSDTKLRFGFFYIGRKKTKDAVQQHAIKSSPHSILFVSICCILTSSIWTNGNPYYL